MNDPGLLVAAGFVAMLLCFMLIFILANMAADIEPLLEALCELPSEALRIIRTVRRAKRCNHILVDGFGGMGDAVVCCLCGLDKYPEAISLEMLRAKAQGRYIRENDPMYASYVVLAQTARKQREQPRKGASK